MCNHSRTVRENQGTCPSVHRGFSSGYPDQSPSSKPRNDKQVFVKVRPMQTSGEPANPSLAVSTGKRYTIPMFLSTFRSDWSRAARLLSALLLLASLCGCYTNKANKIRESRFINMDAEVLHVTYSQEKRTETMPNGLVCTFEGKVHLRLPSGKSVTLYQAMTASGVRYLSKNKQYEFVEKGPCCRVFYKGSEIFEGIFCRSK